jgi:hypothetical protein
MTKPSLHPMLTAEAGDAVHHKCVGTLTATQPTSGAGLLAGLLQATIRAEGGLQKLSQAAMNCLMANASCFGSCGLQQGVQLSGLDETREKQYEDNKNEAGAGLLHPACDVKLID